MSYTSKWTDPDANEANLESGDILYEQTIRAAWMQVIKWLGLEHVHNGRPGDGPQWPITPIEDFKTLAFYNSVSWNE